MALPTYRGRFGVAQAQRLLWRAGFGPRPGEAKRLAAKGLAAAVRSLTNPPAAKLTGPKPVTDDGYPIAPNDAWGHDVLWWLDRMVRSNQPLVERMTLNWHDWFATGDVSSTKLLIDQNQLFRSRAFGSFSDLIRQVTVDPAMLVWLSGLWNNRWSPNENYARELMELFTLGASDESGYPYSEDDVREQARALTGWRASWRDDVGYVNFRFDQNYHDRGSKTVFGQSGSFDWEDACRLCIEHEAHPRFLVEKLWRYFIPEAPSDGTRSSLEALYVQSGHQVRPLLGAILRHPRFYLGPKMVKPPIVYMAGLLRARGQGVRGEAWAWLADLSGQRLFRPPNVSGWDEERWLDTSTFRGRWITANDVTRRNEIDPDKAYPRRESAEAAVDKALAFWGYPGLSRPTRSALVGYGRSVEATIRDDWQRGYYRALRQNALRLLVATSPDMQAS